MQEVFTNFFHTNKWGNDESLSGSGSTVSATKYLVCRLDKLLKEYDIKSIFRHTLWRF